ncbi:MAG: TRAP transporter small permease [Pseudomonadota bacterium]
MARLSEASGAAAMIMLFAAVAITCQMIFVRFILNQSTVWQTEAVTFLVIGTTMLGLPFVQLRRGHVNVDLIPSLLSGAARRGLALLIVVLTLVIAVVMLFYGFEMWLSAWERGWTTDTVWAPKLWVPYLAVPLGFGLYGLQLLADLIDEARRPDGQPSSGEA